MSQNLITASLSDEQRLPFEQEISNAAILAAAGSGKTRTLTHLITADLLKGIPASSVVAFTFTEKAADELLARIHQLAKTHLPGVPLEGMYIGTIHGWCLQFLYENSNFYGFEAIDELGLDAFVSRLYDHLQLFQTYGKPYPKAIPDFLADLEIFYNELLDPAQIPPHLVNSFTQFSKILKENRLLTFGSMISEAVSLLRENGNSQLNLQALYVDEFQDVNPAQVELIKSMLPENGKLIGVGDDLQCIYQWRGSDVARILNFKEDFPPATIFRLTDNYRARPEIVEVGNSVANGVLIRDAEKQMNPKRPAASQPVVHFISSESEAEQALAVVKVVSEFHQQGLPWNQMAILLRSVLSSGTAIAEALEAHGVPFNCPPLSRGGQFINNFLLPVFDWLRVEKPEPKNQEEAATLEDKLDEMWAKAQQFLPQTPDIEDRYWDGLHHWEEILASQKNEGYDVRGRLYDFLDSVGIRLSPDDNDLTVSLGIASQIIRSVEEIHRRRISGQDRRTSRGVTSEVYFSLERRHADFGESLPVGELGDQILLTTVHQAKGLEWAVVILPQVAAHRFPVKRRPHGTSFPHEIAGRYGTNTDDERRLFYVAVTRARERLFLLDTSLNNDKVKSVFIRDLESAGLIFPERIEDLSPALWQLSPDEWEKHDPSPVALGLSDVLLYIECPYSYGLRRIAGIQAAVGDELGYGKGLHEIIQRRFGSKEAMSDSELKEEMNVHVHIPLMSEEQETRARNNIRESIRALEGIGVFEGKVESEVNIEIVFPEGIVNGIIDGVERLGDGRIRVRDWKSSLHSGLLHRYERQLRFYSYALEKQGMTVAAADLIDVSATKKAKSLVSHSIDISSDQMQRTWLEVQSALQHIRAGDFDPKPSPTVCSVCDMKRVCSRRYQA